MFHQAFVSVQIVKKKYCLFIQTLSLLTLCLCSYLCLCSSIQTAFVNLKLHSLKTQSVKPKMKLMKHNFTDRNVLNVHWFRMHDNNKLNNNDLTDPYAILGTVFAHCHCMLFIAYCPLVRKYRFFFWLEIKFAHQHQHQSTTNWGKPQHTTHKKRRKRIMRLNDALIDFKWIQFAAVAGVAVSVTLCTKFQYREILNEENDS